MKCSTETISLYLDRELAEPERQMVATHLHECGDCQRKLHRLQVIGEVLAAVPAEEVPNNLFPQVMAGLESCASQTAAKGHRQRVLVGALSFILAATGIFLAAIPFLVFTMPADQTESAFQTMDGTLTIVEQVISDPASISDLLFEGLASMHDVDAAINGLPILGVTLLLSALVLFLFQLSRLKADSYECPESAT